MLYIHNARLYTGRHIVDDGAVLIEDDRILAIGPTLSIACPPNAISLDAIGLWLAPGYIDVQLNGAFGMDFTADPDTIWAVAAHLPQFGVTAFLPTIVTSPLETVARAQAVLRAGPPPGFCGAWPVGLHLEGPFLNPAKRGAHNATHMRLPTLSDGAIAEWSRNDGISMVTLAPELPGASAMIRTLHEREVVVSAGHSLATYEEALTGLSAGLGYGTHLFNAMPTLEQRSPGLVGALLTDARVVVGIIPDGVHLHPGSVKLAWQAKGAAGVNVVTDAMAALGRPPGHYRLGDFDVTVDETSARLSDGRLAGSILSLDTAVRNLMAFTGCSAAEALATATTTPARLLGLADRGQLAPGFLADLVLLTPGLHVVKTIVAGKILYSTQVQQGT